MSVKGTRSDLGRLGVGLRPRDSTGRPTTDSEGPSSRTGRLGCEGWRTMFPMAADSVPTMSRNSPGAPIPFLGEIRSRGPGVVVPSPHTEGSAVFPRTGTSGTPICGEPRPKSHSETDGSTCGGTDPVYRVDPGPRP